MPHFVVTTALQGTAYTLLWTTVKSTSHWILKITERKIRIFFSFPHLGHYDITVKHRGMIKTCLSPIIDVWWVGKLPVRFGMKWNHVTEKSSLFDIHHISTLHSTYVLVIKLCTSHTVQYLNFHLNTYMWAYKNVYRTIFISTVVCMTVRYRSIFECLNRK